MLFQAEKKHKSFQELDRFMHYYTRFKNHEHSYKVLSACYSDWLPEICAVLFMFICSLFVLSLSVGQLEQKLMKTAKEKMEQLSRAFISRESLNFACLDPACAAEPAGWMFLSGSRWRHSSRHPFYRGRRDWAAEDAPRAEVLLPIRLLSAAGQHAEGDIWTHAGTLV